MRGSFTLVLCGLLAGLVLPSCTSRRAMTPPPSLHDHHYTSFDGDPFPYRKWLPKGGNPKMVVVAFHGISGASDDYENLGRHLQRQGQSVAVYALELRGQGWDTDVQRRGDIRSPEEWFRDAQTFTTLVKTRHPGARVVWCGESMGSLIALHAFNWSDTPPCEALVLASPIVTIPPGRLPAGKRVLFRTFSTFHPTGRVALEDLFDEQNTKLTHDTIHQEQVEQTPWHVPEFSWRLLHHLERLVRGMSGEAARVGVPVLILHGGKDIFATTADVSSFPQSFPPATPVRFHIYPDSHHLLFYDHERARVLKDTERWLLELP